MLPFKKEFTKAQIDEINKAYQTDGRLVIKTTRNQIEHCLYKRMTLHL